MQKPNPRGCCGNPGICLECAQGHKRLKGLPRAPHCTDCAQTSGNVSPTVELCRPHPTFRTKVRARRDVPEEKKITIVHIHITRSVRLALPPKNVCLADRSPRLFALALQSFTLCLDPDVDDVCQDLDVDSYCSDDSDAPRGVFAAAPDVSLPGASEEESLPCTGELPSSTQVNYHDHVLPTVDYYSTGPR